MQFFFFQDKVKELLRLQEEAKAKWEAQTALPKKQSLDNNINNSCTTTATTTDSAGKAPGSVNEKLIHILKEQITTSTGSSKQQNS